MSTINEMADRVIDTLADASTAPGPSPYLRQRDLMEAAGVRTVSAFDQVLTRAAIRVKEFYPGYAIVTNIREGYRMVDEISLRDKRVERGRLRKARTVLKRLAVTLGAGRNSEVLKMVGRQVEAIVDTVIEPALAMLDDEIGV